MDVSPPKASMVFVLGQGRKVLAGIGSASGPQISHTSFHLGDATSKKGINAVLQAAGEVVHYELRTCPLHHRAGRDFWHTRLLSPKHRNIVLYVDTFRFEDTF